MFSYKAQRWLWNEREQLQRRYLRFDLDALIRVTEDAAGSGAKCAEVTKLPEGNFNKTFLIRMDNGHELIARLPNPNAGQSHYTTASEVATMDYVCSFPLYLVAHIPPLANLYHRFGNASRSLFQRYSHTTHKRNLVLLGPNISLWKGVVASNLVVCGMTSPGSRKLTL
jgi:hypothetical protein